ncbi:MAG: DUF4975 domain-containing protein [Prevotella sp.]|nr:DUF4975 domain-containing protein [Candidatus Prevotella equi]
MKKNFYSNIMSSLAALMIASAAGSALASCSDETFEGDTPKDWAGTSDVFVSTDETGFSTYFNPSVGRVGDPMPYYDKKNEEFRILYLQEYDMNGASYHPMWGVSTKDGANYTALGEILPAGAAAEQDAGVGTGCCYYNEHDKLYYIYYTGHNGACAQTEAVMRATSEDGIHYTKDMVWMLRGVTDEFNKTDFRDPQIFEEGGKYHMIISTRPIKGGNPVFAEYVSDNMRDWEKADQFNMLWERMYECPDVFQMGDWWYIVYSDSNKRNWGRDVKYVKAHSWAELKSLFGDSGYIDHNQKSLDSRAFYAGKTASNGTDRYIWGWCPFRSGQDLWQKNNNAGGSFDDTKDVEPNWSGSLVCHKIIQHEDGTLTLGEVPGIRAKYNKAAEVKVMKSQGAEINGSDVTLKGDDAYMLYNRLGYHNHISFTVKTSNNWDKFGISFVRGSNEVTIDPKKFDEHLDDAKNSSDLNVTRYFTMVINPENENWRQINFEEEGTFMWGDKKETSGRGFIPGINSYGFSRPADNTYKVDIYTDNSVMVMYINDNVCYTNRIYGIQKNCWSINNYGGEINISGMTITQY